MPAADQCFVIFEGGGAKGITHLGALKALDSVGLARIGAAGTSAGAIIAALTAVGYTAEELFRSSGDGNILSDLGLTPIDLLGREDWNAFSKLRTPGGQVRARQGGLRLKIVASVVALIPPVVLLWVFSLARTIGRPTLLRSVWRIVENFGFFSTDHARDLLNTLMRNKLMQENGGPPDFICFRDINPRLRPYCCRLKIIATNLTNGSLELFDETTGDVVVADAVAASFSIPLLQADPRTARR